MLWYGKVGTAESFPMPDDQPWDPLPGWILMNSSLPNVRPDRFGDWFSKADGDWVWVKYPDPPFPVVFHEGKLKNSDTLAELLASSLPGNIAMRMEGAESELDGIADAMAVEVEHAHSYAQQALQSANSAGASKTAVDEAIASLPAPIQFESVTVTLGAGGSANVTFTKTYTAAPFAIPVTRFAGAQAFIAVPGAPTKTGVAVSGKRSRGTLLLTSGPFEDANAGDIVQFFVIGR